MTFQDKLDAAARKNRSLLCVGLDVDPDLMGDRDLARFCQRIIDATSDLVCAYKPNWGFYEALGLEGLGALMQLRERIPASIPVIGDVKRGDIGNTSTMSARAMFDVFGFDAVTVNPYLGFDALEPYIAYRDRTSLVLCRTSNPGAEEFQSLLVEPSSGNGLGPAPPMRLYERVAEQARIWNTYGNVGLVVGATYPEELERVRELCPDQVILVPGIGPQGGDLVTAVHAGVDRSGQHVIISASRQVLYASRAEDYAEAARAAALRLRDAINAARGM